MTTFRIFLAGLLCLAPASAAHESGESGSISEYTTSSLQDILRLDASQVANLDKLSFELEDAAFPLFQKLVDQTFALQRAFRSDEPNPTVLEMLGKDLEQTLAQSKELADRYRAKARALLNPNQRFALYSLETALKLNGAAREAVDANLIEDPWGGNPYAEGFFDFMGEGLTDSTAADVPVSITNPGFGSQP
ncbi:MAG: hypothetical protein OXC19_06210 [Bryobacterales bacterium]|nr:hypothetical protein [Bryobacterales bacterium]